MDLSSRWPNFRSSCGIRFSIASNWSISLHVRWLAERSTVRWKPTKSRRSRSPVVSTDGFTRTTRFTSAESTTQWPPCWMDPLSGWSISSALRSVDAHRLSTWTWSTSLSTSRIWTSTWRTTRMGGAEPCRWPTSRCSACSCPIVYRTWSWTHLAWRRCARSVWRSSTSSTRNRFASSTRLFTVESYQCSGTSSTCSSPIATIYWTTV